MLDLGVTVDTYVDDIEGVIWRKFQLMTQLLPYITDLQYTTKKSGTHPNNLGYSCSTY